MRNFELQLFKAHVGIENNDLADINAKQSLQKTMMVDLGLPKIRIKFLLQEELLTNWIVAWEVPTTRGRFTTHMLISKVSLKRQNYHDIITQNKPRSFSDLLHKIRNKSCSTELPTLWDECHRRWTSLRNFLRRPQRYQRS